MREQAQASISSRWYADWQSSGHARHFDERSHLSRAALVRNYETFNDVRLLAERLPASGAGRLLEVGCATGEFSRYLAIRFPQVLYTGVDVSESALSRARQKYPKARFAAADPARTVLENSQAAGLEGRPDWVYSKDVMHHQVEPWRFLAELLDAAEQGVVLRTRTRDRGATVLDPERSCQYHYQGWMPYLVLNIDELQAFILERRPGAQLTLVRHRTVLGGRENRFLPKECYLPETGTAETSIAIDMNGARPGSVRVEDRQDIGQTPSFWSRIRRLV